MSCGVGRTCGSDPALLWLWCRPAAAAPIGSLAWEPPYAEGAALKKQKGKKEKKKKVCSRRVDFSIPAVAPWDWECWDAGSIPCRVQWAKDLALPQLQLRWCLWFGSDPWPRSSMCLGLAKKWKKEKKKSTSSVPLNVPLVLSPLSPLFLPAGNEDQMPVGAENILGL